MGFFTCRACCKIGLTRILLCHAQVVLVKHDGKYYALKTLLKQQIIDMGLHVRSRAPPHIPTDCCL